MNNKKAENPILPSECFETLAFLYDGHADEQEIKLRQAYTAYIDFLQNGTHVPNHLGLLKVWNEMPDNFVRIAKGGKEPVDPEYYAQLDLQALEAHIKNPKTAGEIIANSLNSDESPAQKVLKQGKKGAAKINMAQDKSAVDRIAEFTVRSGLPFIK